MWNRELAQIDLSQLTEERQVVVFDYSDPFGQPARGFAVMWEGKLKAYRNLCPHWGVELDHEGKFFDDEEEELMCHIHGATPQDDAPGVLLRARRSKRLTSTRSPRNQGSIGSCDARAFH